MALSDNPPLAWSLPTLALGGLPQQPQATWASRFWSGATASPSPNFPPRLAHYRAQPIATAPIYLVTVSPQGLELFRRRTRVTVSPPETWVLNLEAGDQAHPSHSQHTGGLPHAVPSEPWA